MAALVPGALVTVSGLRADAKPVPEMATEIQPMSLNGEKAQLVEFDEKTGKWIAGTFKGVLVAVDAKFLQPLPLDDVDHLDFVLGPKSDPDLVGVTLAQTLGAKGYANIRVFVAEADTEDMLTVANTLEKDNQFSRLAMEFEPGYLGRGPTMKVLNLDPMAATAPSMVRESPLRAMDNNFSAVSAMLEPYSQELLGFDIYSRTSLFLRMPITAEEEDKYPPPDLDEDDAEGYLHMMFRRQLVVLQFVGPASGRLTLVPKRPGGAEVVLKAEPNTMVCIHTSQYDYSFVPEGDCLTLQSFFLKPPAVWEVGEITGDVEQLVGGGSGPRPPKLPQITVRAMHCRYGGGSDSRMAYWNMTGKAATDGSTDVPGTRYESLVYYDPEMKYGGTYTKHGCFGIDGVDLFDAKFFEISPAEAKMMDPCQRQVMEVSYTALLGAGYEKRALQRKSENIGHFVGIDKDDWQQMGDIIREVGGGGAMGAAAAAMAILANRFSFALNLKGASMQIDTACSSSLVCTHVSKMHLRMQDWDPMPCSIVNGLNLMLHPGPFIGCSAANMLSHEGRCFTFNATADGYARGELCGAIAFKSQKYDDEAVCCLAGTQANQDGRSASLTAPNGPAQERCLQAVLRETGMKPSEIDMFECHGTGTSLGDPIEIGSFRKVMSAAERVDPLFITSSKSNICHGEGGAGLAGFFKCCLQVSHCEGAPNVHLKILNPHLDLDGFPCQPLSENSLCRDDAAYCGVSSFGFGGTNAHCEAWGRNIMTSRGSASQDPYRAFQKKLEKAPPGEVTITGDEVEDWETTGCDPRAELGDTFMIKLDEDGIAEWEKAEPELPDSYGDEFAIIGSMNGWSESVDMERHATIPGLWTGTVKIGNTGEEEFQIIADGDSSMIYCPNTKQCYHKAAPIQGPMKAEREFSWVLRGEKGDIYKVEFYQQDETKRILWMRQ